MQNVVPHSARSPEVPAPSSGPTSVPSGPLVKLERHSPSYLRCLSPPSPSGRPFPSFTHIPSFASGRAPTLTGRKKRSAHPYTHPPLRVSCQHSSVMSAPHYGNWPSDTVKDEQSECSSKDLAHVQRRASDGDQPSYHFTPVSDR